MMLNRKVNNQLYAEIMELKKQLSDLKQEVNKLNSTQGKIAKTKIWMLKNVFVLSFPSVLVIAGALYLKIETLLTETWQKIVCILVGLLVFIAALYLCYNVIKKENGE